MCKQVVHGLWWVTLSLCPSKHPTQPSLAVHEVMIPLVSFVVGPRLRMELDEDVKYEITESAPDPTMYYLVLFW